IGHAIVADLLRRIASPPHAIADRFLHLLLLAGIHVRKTADRKRASQLVASDWLNAVGRGSMLSKKIDAMRRQSPAKLQKTGCLRRCRIGDHDTVRSGVERRSFERKQFIAPKLDLPAGANLQPHMQSGAGRSPAAASYSKSIAQISRNGSSSRLMPTHAT